MKFFQLIRMFVGKYKKFAILTPIMVILEVALDIVIPYLMSKIIDVGVANKDLGYIVKIGSLMLAAAALAMCFGALSGRFSALASSGFAYNLRTAMFNKVQDFSFANVDKFSTASLVTRMTSDITMIQMPFMMMIRMMVRAPFQMILAAVMAVRINAKLSIVFAVAVPILAVVLAVITTKAFPLFQKMFYKIDDMNSVVQENLISIRVVKAFVRKKYEIKKFDNSAGDLRNTQLKAEMIVIWNRPVMTFVMYSCMLAVCWFGGRLIIKEELLTGEFFSFMSYISQVLMSLMMLSMTFIGLVMSRAAVRRVGEVLTTEPSVKDPVRTGDAPTVADGSIEFDHVSFRYETQSDENRILEDINLKIPSGTMVGVLGGTGSGKTTLVSLIPRFYDVVEGTLRVGGVDVRDYTQHELRENVSMVLQTNVLFSGTIRENLLWGKADATEEEMIAACKAAQAHDFIMSFPNGYDTELGQGGVNVSGGQKQRLCIARALIKKPKIVILDDSTSAVDTTTDRQIRDAMKRELADTTSIIISQRVTSLMDADMIIVMDDGKICEVGNHDELMAKHGVYREVFESQQKGVQISA